jgi:hypothetical protein
MKIWIFNILVAGALAYLFLGEAEQGRVKDDLEWAKGEIETKLQTAPHDEGKPALAAESSPPAAAPPIAPTPISEKPVATVVAPPPPEAPQAGTPAGNPEGSADVSPHNAAATGGGRPGEIVVQDLPPLDDPGAARRRAVVLDRVSTPEASEAAGASQTRDTPSAATAARERRDALDALDALAEDMELLFADKTAR